MALNFFQRRRILKRLNFLEAIPVRVSDFEENDEGKISVIIPKFKNEKLNAFMVGRRSRHFLIHFDLMGSKTWKLIDGKRNVEQICETLKTEAGDDTDEIIERTTKFMSMLYEERYITFRELQQEQK